MPLPISFVDAIDNWRVFHGKDKGKDADKPAHPSGDTTPKTHDSVVPGDSTLAEKGEIDNSKVRILSPRVFTMALIVSIGGLIFGYDTGQISGFLEMNDFIDRFGENGAFSNVRSGTIVGLLSIGTLIGALCSAPIADKFGRKTCIITWNIVFCVGVVVQIATVQRGHWYQIAIGRWVAGLGVGGLSVLTPMYQSETAPRQVRGALVSCYQLFITCGIWLAYCINFGTHDLNGPQQWRIPMGIGFIFPVIMGVGICFLPESPRWDYRHNNIDRARVTISKSYGVPINHYEVRREMQEIKEKFEAENAGGGKHKWYEIFTGPRMLYRTCLGVTMQALQQLTGANFFFYYGKCTKPRRPPEACADYLPRHHRLQQHRPLRLLRHLHHPRFHQLRHDHPGPLGR
jgi:MFS transporter, SP family, sugar:H+ symporter